MSVVTACATCGGPLQRRAGRGRPSRYCTVSCRRDAEFTKRNSGRMFGYVIRHYQQLGEATVRANLASDPNFLDTALGVVETHMPAPQAQERISPEQETEIVEALFEIDRRLSGYQVLAVGHDTPLPSSADIDEAERTGDWSAMLRDTLKDMTWQLSHGYKPDLSEFYGGENTIYEGNDDSERNEHSEQ